MICQNIECKKTIKEESDKAYINGKVVCQECFCKLRTGIRPYHSRYLKRISIKININKI